MATPVDPAVSGGSKPAIVESSASLQQPTDAVPMESMSSSQPDQTQPLSSTAPSHPEPSTDATAFSAPKGKDRDAQDIPPPPPAERQDSMAIGPAVDDIGSVSAGSPDSGPVCNITLLLTTGSRHPYKIDAKYLSRRNVAVPDQTENGQPDPFSISIYTLKELILREWRSDWEAKPASPSSIRLIHFGKLLDDKEQLRKYQFSTENPNVVHMSIRPQDLDEEEPKGGSKHLSSGGSNGQRERSGGCCVIL